MQLTAAALRSFRNEKVELPQSSLFSLPEKVLQFGTGVLLRGLPDYFIDKANKRGVFNGRVVVVKSTDRGNTSAFDVQDNLYTICVRGVEHGKKVEVNIINAAISRVINAAEQWKDVLACASSPDMQVIVSNTTEVGIQYSDDLIHNRTPSSFPGKLLSFLYERFQAFGGSIESGMIIIPTELITDNGARLKSIVLQLASFNQLESSFVEWLEQHNHFCNSLVDRIVPGQPDADVLNSLCGELGYRDDLLIVAEVYRLWAIEGDERIKKILSFSAADEGVIVEPEITIYKELKLRLLNGTHTLSCGLAFLAGFSTVKEAMDDDLMSSFIHDLMIKEIGRSIPYDVGEEVAHDFGQKVLDRFRNQEIKHHWISITMQYSSKLKMRVVPVLLKHYEASDVPPARIVLGFAAYLLFTKPVRKKGSEYFGEYNGDDYLINDDAAPSFFARWNNLAPAELVHDVLSDAGLWGFDLSTLAGFSNAVLHNLNFIMTNGAKEALSSVQPKKLDEEVSR
ncbi:MAG TPA: tagaturonate reductase [Chitinophagaceae bacterium]|nr:tagaturonate reductase [Chitinophagaceae bacterium]